MSEHQAEIEYLNSNLNAEIINTMKNYIQTYIEKPNPILGNMPICPFAKKARQNNLICYVVYAFQVSKDLSQDSHLLDLIRTFRDNKSHEVLLVIHPDRCAISLQEMKKFMQNLNKLIHPLGCVALGGHPLDDFNIKGIFTRRDPFINFVVQDQQSLKRSSELLKFTTYYDNWTAENLDSIAFPLLQGED